MSPELAEEENVVYADVWSLGGSEWNHVQQITVNYWYFFILRRRVWKKSDSSGVLSVAADQTAAEFLIPERQREFFLHAGSFVQKQVRAALRHGCAARLRYRLSMNNM